MVTVDEIQRMCKEEKIEALLREIFSTLNVVDTESNHDTARRVAKMWVNEIFRNDVNESFKEQLWDNLKSFPNENKFNSELIITTVPFHAFCEHHLLPFSGKVQLGYLPNERVIGLSKIPRIVDFWCHTPQLQEKLCSDILSTFVEYLEPNFACVRVIAEHSCVACRGIERDCQTDTFNFYSKGIDETNVNYHLDNFFKRVGESR